jgi:hypothetical protein
MTSFAKLLIAGAAISGLAAPAAAQYQNYPSQQSYPQPYQQSYGYQQSYPQQYRQGYGYQQGYNNPVGQIVDQLLGNRYNVSDRQAVSRCASAVMAQAQSQYGGYGNGYGNNGYNGGYSNLRVTSITDVQRRTNGLRVRGTLGSGYGHNAYQSRGYAGGDLTFRCNVDYRGSVTGIRIGRGDAYRGH